MRPHLAQRPASRAVAQHHSRIAPLRLPVASASLPKDASDGWLDLTRLVTGGGGSKSPYDDLAAEIGKQASQGREWGARRVKADYSMQRALFIGAHCAPLGAPCRLVIGRHGQGLRHARAVPAPGRDIRIRPAVPHASPLMRPYIELAGGALCTKRNLMLTPPLTPAVTASTPLTPAVPAACPSCAGPPCRLNACRCTLTWQGGTSTRGTWLPTQRPR